MKSQSWNWSDLRVFLAVLDTGSTLAASRRLGMAQPTVARRIDALEHATGLRLFERDTRGAQPTSAARDLEEAARAVATAIEALEGKVQRCTGGQNRPIRITAPSGNFSDNFARTLTEFTELHPGTHFEFVASYDRLDLMAGEADVAIRISTSPGDDRLICRKMTEATATLYASRGYAERYGLPVSGDDLAGHRFVTYSGRLAEQPFSRWLAARIAPDQIVSRCGEPESLFAAVKAGFGLGPIPTGIAEGDGTLLACFPPPEGTGVPSWLVISPDAWVRPEVKAFARFFVPRFRSYIRRQG
ncbi:LysR family transcriptional regulator [Roseibacterium sp. SDUM158016]|uniref:LysR family transcriptional regulator n=1 Tax=Roseicyclus sediminis TaxID=2980997 RepID=UPI0021D101DC|nr:LysR family transcriptional regulator [Roseibacterium sp. SDUM158016]MCU4654620.1 LysR family transcriptional regulator [Roseibacterium sp. SDUM158016]